jgi:hypothetical protein
MIVLYDFTLPVDIRGAGWYKYQEQIDQVFNH